MFMFDYREEILILAHEKLSHFKDGSMDVLGKIFPINVCCAA
jgi:hypothetical protein